MCIFTVIVHSLRHFQQLRQRVYDFRTQLADRAERAVEDFFDSDPDFSAAEFRKTYISWALPRDREKIDNHGRSITIPADFYPFMWESVQVEEETSKPIVCERNTSISLY